MEHLVHILHKHNIGDYRGANKLTRDYDGGKDRLGALKFLLVGKDVCKVKSDLTPGIVTDDTLDKTEKLYTEIDSLLIDISVSVNT